MMNSNRIERRGELYSRLHALASISLAALLGAGLGTPVYAQQKLAAGDWFGEFITHEEDLFKIKYKVRYDQTKDELSITMINLDLPRSKFKDELTDIRIEDGWISFKIERKFETKDCRLKTDNNGYRGSCTSDAGNADEFSTISMYPKSADGSASGGKLDSENSEAQTRNGKSGKPDKNNKPKKAEVDVEEVKASSSGDKNKSKNKNKNKN